MEKSLPASIESERAVLGSILMNRDAIVAVAPLLTTPDFYVEQHAWIYEAMIACYDRREPPDTRLVSEELRRRGRLDAVGGIAALSSLVDAVPTSYHAEYYARMVERTSRLRKLIAAGGQIAWLAYDEQEDLDATIAKAQAALTAACTNRGERAFVSAADALGSLIDSYSADTPPGISTGWYDLDSLLGGLRPDELTIVAARPSVGKSAWAASLGMSLARAWHAVLLFSLEMSRQQIVMRIAAQTCRIDLQRIRNRTLSREDLTAIISLQEEIEALPLLIDDTPSRTMHDVRTAALRYANEHGTPGAVIVDYLGLLNPGGRYAGNKVQEVAEISRGLKLLAREMQAPVVALSQLSRAVEQRSSKVPMLSDLRDSGALEQDADNVLFLHREEIYDADTDKKGVMEVHIAKQRNGPLGIVPLRYDATTTRVDNLVRYRTPAGYENGSYNND